MLTVSMTDKSSIMITQAQSPSQFFSPSYFTPFYFPPLYVQAGGGDNGGSVSVYRDRDGFDSIIAALLDTGVFASIVFGSTPDGMTVGADLTPLAIITPESWVEIDDADPIVIVRQVFYSLTIAVRGEEPIIRYDLLDQLSCIVLNAIDGSDLGGMCLPDWTLLRAGRYEPVTRHPEQRLVMSGEFAYLIRSFSGHNTNV